MKDTISSWTKVKRNVFSFLQALEGSSSYPFERIQELQLEVVELKSRALTSAQCCGAERSRG